MRPQIIISKIIMHIKKGTFLNVVLNNLSQKSVFMKAMYCMYCITTRIELGIRVQKKFLPRPYQAISFPYYDAYMAKVNPKLVEYVVKTDYLQYNNSKPWCFVMEGDWDKHNVLLEHETPDNDRSITVRTIREIFVENLNYKKCTQYLSMKETIERGNTAYYWCSKIEDLDKYFGMLYEIFNDISTNNYKTQKELLNNKPDNVNIKEKGDEIRVLIDRKGNLLLGSGGTHRLLMAKLLKVDEIPVLIEGVHIEWINECYKKHKTNILDLIQSELRIEG